MPHHYPTAKRGTAVWAVLRKGRRNAEHYRQINLLAKDFTTVDVDVAIMKNAIPAPSSGYVPYSLIHRANSALRSALRPFLSQERPQHAIQKRDLLSQLTDLMLRHDIDVTADNCSFFLDVISGKNGAAYVDLKAIESEGRTVNQDWIRSFTRKESDELNKVMTNLEAINKIYSSQMKKTISENNSYQKNISTFQKELDKADSENDNLLGILLDATEKMVVASNHFSTELDVQLTKSKAMESDLAFMKKELNTDYLTEIYNRKYIDNFLEDNFQSYKEQGKSIHIAFCDVDDFKFINDNFGHEIGDRVLKCVGRKINDSMKTNSFVGRYGGDEFIIVFENMKKNEVSNIVSKFTKEIVEKNFRIKDDDRNLGRISLSLGVCEATQYDNVAEAIVKCDNALYVAKKNGKNRVVFN